MGHFSREPWVGESDPWSTMMWILFINQVRILISKSRGTNFEIYGKIFSSRGGSALKFVLRLGPSSNPGGARAPPAPQVRRL